jgi:hypothetical protein
VAASCEVDEPSSSAMKVGQFKDGLGEVHCCKWLVIISGLCN